jgi:predicted HicB family RNase H-like nuclease
MDTKQDRKTVQIKVEDAVHRALRIEALEEGKTLARILVEALEAHVRARREVRP